MPDKSKDSEKSKWLMKPPAADEANISIAVGDQAKLSPELIEQLENLARQLNVDPAAKAKIICGDVVIGECRVHMTCQGVSVE